MPPQCVRDATTAYLKAEDAIGQWLAECCAQRRRSADQMRLRIVEKLGERNNETSARKGVYAKTGRPRLWAATRPWHRLVLPGFSVPETRPTWRNANGRSLMKTAATEVNRGFQ
jgi:hypothetical protein